jgi:hypothetical protein
MTAISFFTPIFYSEGREERTGAERALEKIDDYFYLGGKKACVFNNGTVALSIPEEQRSLFLTVLKVLSFFTLIIPVLMLILKGVLRAVEKPTEGILLREIVKCLDFNRTDIWNDPSEHLTGKLSEAQRHFIREFLACLTLYFKSITPGQLQKNLQSDCFHISISENGFTPLLKDLMTDNSNWETTFRFLEQMSARVKCIRFSTIFQNQTKFLLGIRVPFYIEKYLSPGCWNEQIKKRMDRLSLYIEESSLEANMIFSKEFFNRPNSDECFINSFKRYANHLFWQMSLQTASITNGKLIIIKDEEGETSYLWRLVSEGSNTKSKGDTTSWLHQILNVLQLKGCIQNYVIGPTKIEIQFH